MSPSPLPITLIGYGAIGRALAGYIANAPRLRLAHVVIPAAEIPAAQMALGPHVDVRDAVPHNATLVVECAGHSALIAHIIPALSRGTECAVLSIGALSERGLPERLAEAAQHGQTQVHLLSGAIGGIDAISAAKHAGLTRVTYIGRKPPAGWRGTAAEAVVNLDSLTQATAFFQGSARDAAHAYPKNANVAATVALAGLGFEATQARLIADPTIAENIHEIEIEGVFGRMQLSMMNNPLPENPKTSALTVLSVVRFLHNRVSELTL